MTKSKKTVTIGICAYNEELGIGTLLAEIANQRQHGLIIERVIVCSDASTDKTNEIVQNFTTLRTKLLIHNKRTGKAGTLNSIIKACTSEALVLIDGDVRITDPLFTAKLVDPILHNTADLCGAKVDEIPPVNILQHILRSSMEFKRLVFASIRSGDNVYTCHGRARAFSRNLYRKIKFKESVNEDAYSYLFATYHTYPYRYIPEAVVWYRLPIMVRDHELQSVRFFQSTNISVNEFGEKFVKHAYAIPKSVILKILIPFIIHHPIFLSYVVLVMYLRIKSMVVPKINNTWTVAVSSKTL